MTEPESHLLRFLYEQTRGCGPVSGVAPHRMGQFLQLNDFELAGPLSALNDSGLIELDMIAMTTFNDPIALQGVQLTNIFLTQKGWEVAQQLT